MTEPLEILLHDDRPRLPSMGLTIPPGAVEAIRLAMRNGFPVHTPPTTVALPAVPPTKSIYNPIITLLVHIVNMTFLLLNWSLFHNLLWHVLVVVSVACSVFGGVCSAMVARDHWKRKHPGSCSPGCSQR